ncbi:MAG: PHB depolymerase family esterase [Casimicrobiaceae bacterium]
MLRPLWNRIKAFLARLRRRAPPAPGRFETGAKFSIRGALAVAPWIWPRREYLVYVPQGHSRWRQHSLLVLVHGCRQTAEDIARSARITALADGLGCLVLLPEQNPRANSWGCWNWFDQRTTAGGGETAILAAQIRAVRRRYRVHKKRVFAAGLSSGAGLVTALAMHHSRLLAGIFVHSGVAAGAASSPMAALSVLKRGPDQDVATIGRAARAAAGRDARAVPALVLQGERDEVVSPHHATEIVRQVLAFARHPQVAAAPAPLPTPAYERHSTTADGRHVTVREWRGGTRLLARQVLVRELGHAWSGGDPELAFTDPGEPQATEILRAFMADVLD